VVEEPPADEVKQSEEPGWMVNCEVVYEVVPGGEARERHEHRHLLVDGNGKHRMQLPFESLIRKKTESPAVKLTVQV
jgi:hypothetical protein